MQRGPATSTPRSLPVCEGVLGARHPADPTGPPQPRPLDRRGWDAAGARDQFAALLPVRERVIGSEHRDALTTLGNLASWTGRAGDAAGARDQFVALLPMRAGPGPTTPTPWRPAPPSTAGPGRPGTRPGPATSSPPCCLSANGSWARASRHAEKPRHLAR